MSECCSGYYSGSGASDFTRSVKAPTLLDRTSEGDVSCFWEDSDSDDEDDESDWAEDEWPLDHPLPLPEWGCRRPELKFSSEDEYQIFFDQTTTCLQQCLSSLCYDTISNFLVFSKQYLSSKGDYDDLKEFYRDYDPHLLPGRYNCVGLTAVLASKLSNLERSYPGLKDAMYQVSCEEEVNDFEKYTLKTPSAKSCLIEHVLLCIKIQLSGRAGVMLFDPGYHISQPITVMEDGMSPQSGKLKGSTTRSDVARAYTYHYLPSNSSLIAWETHVTRNGKSKGRSIGIIRPEEPFLSSIDIVERRNLIYAFKTLLGRDQEGNLKCGLYFPVRNCSGATVTLFYQAKDVLQHKKVPMTYFLTKDFGDKDIEEAIAAVATGSGRTPWDLKNSLVSVAHLLNDINFVQEVLTLDKEIEDIENN